MNRFGKAVVHAGLAGMLAILATSCATVPETGRRQLNLMSSGEEMQLGFSAFEEIKANTPRSTDRAAQAMVEQVGQRISSVANLPGAQWEFILFESEEPNAFCLPGGKVGVYTGILPITQDEAGLATVMSHEVAHAVARHGAERISEAMLVQLGAGALAIGLHEEDATTAALIFAAYGIGTTVGRSLPHSRKQESEADYIGLLYMARSGYNPEAALGFWQRFAAYNDAKGGSPVWFLSTHPLDKKRIEQIRKWLPEATREYEKHSAHP